MIWSNEMNILKVFEVFGGSVVGWSERREEKMGKKKKRWAGLALEFHPLLGMEVTGW